MWPRGYTLISIFSIVLCIVYGSKYTELCRACLDRSDTKICYGSEFSNIKCCDENDFSEGCEEDQWTTCISRSDGEVNAAYLLCPMDRVECGNQGLVYNFFLNEYTSGYTFASNDISSSNICWYSMMSETNSITNLKLSQLNLRNAKAEVYFKPDIARGLNENFSGSKLGIQYISDFGTNQTISIDVKKYEDVYVLVTPNSTTPFGLAQVNFEVEDNRDNSGGAVKGLLFFGIIFGSICLCCICTPIIIWRVYKKRKGGKNIDKEKEDQLDNYAKMTAQPPQINYSNQQPPNTGTYHPQNYGMNDPNGINNAGYMPVQPTNPGPNQYQPQWNHREV